MESTKNLARVILRSDGMVHIAFNGARTIYATPQILVELFSDPIEFIEVGSHAYKESTIIANRKRVPLEEVLGLTLATVNSDKQIVCDFPELFRFFLSAISDDTLCTKPLDMKSFELEGVLSDEKSFLLRYYLEFTSYFKSVPAIKRNLELRGKVQSAIVREILNTFFDDELPEPTESISVADQIGRSESEQLLKKESDSEDGDLVSASEYAEIIGLSTQCILIKLKAGLIPGAFKNEAGRWRINKNVKPIDWDLRKKRKRKEKLPPGEKHYKRKKTGSAADVEEHILRLKLFTPAVAPYIHTFEELDYYQKRSYHEVCFDGRHILVVDVNPYYVSSKTGVSNRERMREGKPPVVPHRDKEEYVFHVHHVAQYSSPTSVFAIIPQYDHNGKELSAVFHQGTPNQELHGPEFEAQKKNFWRSFVDAYDAADNDFNRIPYLNPRIRR